MLALTVTDPVALFAIYCGGAVLVLMLVLLIRRLRGGGVRGAQKPLPGRVAINAASKPRRKALRRGLEVGITTREEVRARWGEPLLQEIKGMTKTGTRERWVLDGSDGDLVLWGPGAQGNGNGGGVGVGLVGVPDA